MKNQHSALPAWCGLAGILLLSLALAGCQPGTRPAPATRQAVDTVSVPAPTLTPDGQSTPAVLAALAVLAVQVDPPGAQVNVDGQVRGTSPVTLTLPGGVHQITAAASGYLTLTQALTLTAGEEGMYTPQLVDILSPTVTLSVRPAKVPWPGQATVSATAVDNRAVTSLQVLVNDQPLGEIAGGELTVELRPAEFAGIVPGATYTITALAQDAEGNTGQASTTVTVEPLSGPGTPVTPEDTTPVPVPTAAIPETPPAPAEPVSYRVETVTIPTYPYQPYLRPTVDPKLNDFPLEAFDRQAYEAAHPRPVPVTYTLAILENQYLRVSILPELGGRIYEIIYKPTGNDELYKNPVIKPSNWGPGTPEHPAGASWWPAAGGIEWGFPVEEHGYVAAVPWGYDHTSGDDGSETVTVFMENYQRPYVAIAITLAPDSAAVTVHPTIVNPLGAPFRFKWWDNAMVAPGPANKAGPDLRFIIPTDQVTVHSTGDESLPAAGEAMSWPVYKGRDMSRLGNWHEWLGFFARPAAQAGFAAVYDTAADEGLVRIFPPSVTRGVKGFGAGFTKPVDPANWTDDGSSYVELHGGLAPTFDDWTELPPGGQVDWTESWYPAAGIRGLAGASDAGAMNVTKANTGIQIAILATRPIIGQLRITLQPGQAPITREVKLAPGRPYQETIPAPAAQGEVEVTLVDAAGHPLMAYKGTVR